MSDRMGRGNIRNSRVAAWHQALGGARQPKVSFVTGYERSKKGKKRWLACRGKRRVNLTLNSVHTDSPRRSASGFQYWTERSASGTEPRPAATAWKLTACDARLNLEAFIFSFLWNLVLYLGIYTANLKSIPSSSDGHQQESYMWAYHCAVLADTIKYCSHSLLLHKYYTALSASNLLCNDDTHPSL